MHCGFHRGVNSISLYIAACILCILLYTTIIIIIFLCEIYKCFCFVLFVCAPLFLQLITYRKQELITYFRASTLHIKFFCFYRFALVYKISQKTSRVQKWCTLFVFFFTSTNAAEVIERDDDARSSRLTCGLCII